MQIKKNIAVSASGLIFNPDTGESFSVNPMGAELIDFLKHGLEKDQITDRIVEQYNVERSIFEKDLDDFVDMLSNYQLVQDAD
jgi:hypothetical protein